MADEKNTTELAENNTEVTVEVTTETEQPKEKKKIESSTIIAIGALLILIAAIILMSVYYFKYKDVRDQNVTLQSHNERLLEDTKKLNAENKSLSGENRELDNSLDKAFEGISARDVVIIRLNEENETLKLIKVQVNELQKVMEGLTTSNTQLKDVYDRLNKITSNRIFENEKLRKKINE